MLVKEFIVFVRIVLLLGPGRQWLETITMVKVYWESGKLPVRMPLYIAIVAIARYLIIDVKDMDATRIIAIAASILVIAIAVLIVRYGHVRFPYPPSRDPDAGPE